MNIFKQFFIAIYRFDKYSELIKIKFFKAFLYFMVITALFNVVNISPIIYKYFSEGGVEGIVQKYIPDFTVENGELDTEYKVDKDIAGQVKIIVDTDTPHSLDSYPTYGGVAIVNKDKLIVKTYDRVESFSFSVLESLGIKNKSDISKLIPSFKIQIFISLIIVIILIALMYFLQVILLSIFVRFLNIVLGAGLRFREIIVLTIYSCTLPIALRIGLGTLGIIVPNIVFLGVALAYAYIGIKSIKNHNGVIIVKR